MPATARRLVAVALLATALGGLAPCPPAQAAPDDVRLAVQAEGRPIERIEAVLLRSSDSAARDGAILARLNRTLAPLEGQPFSRALIESTLAGPRSRLGAGRIGYRVIDAPRLGAVALRVEVDPVAEAEDAGTGPAFPVLHRDERAYLTAILGGGVGAYSDVDPWFGRPDLFTRGNPLAGRRPGDHPGWTEGYVEAGLGGALQLGDSPWYGFGALTGLTSWTVGQDIFRDDTRTHSGLERGYAGLLRVDPESGDAFRLSVGRQNVTLNDGFLIHFVRGSANVGERAATYLGPRNANDVSLVADLVLDDWTLKGFYIDPDELPLVDGRSTFAGLNLRHALTRDLSLDASLIGVPHSDAGYLTPDGRRLPREGVQTVAGHLRWKDAFGVDGLWLESELAHQSHRDIAMSARAGYALVGYRFRDAPWTPSVSYRYAHASGDDPTTSRYERFDPLLSTGFGNWLQGMSFGKITANANLATQRLQANVAPRPGLNLTLDWHGLRAPERNNLGGNPVLSTLSSGDIGDEITLTARWAISRHWYFQGVASHAMPGRALRDIGADEAWTSLQASLYWTF